MKRLLAFLLPLLLFTPSFFAVAETAGNVSESTVNTETSWRPWNITADTLWRPWDWLFGVSTPSPTPPDSSPDGFAGSTGSGGGTTREYRSGAGTGSSAIIPGSTDPSVSLTQRGGFVDTSGRREWNGQGISVSIEGDRESIGRIGQEPRTFGDLADILVGIFNLFGILLVSLCLLFFFWGVAKYIFSSGEKGEGKEGAKKMMLYGGIGLFVVASLAGILQFFGSTFGIHVP